MLAHSYPLPLIRIFRHLPLHIYSLENQHCHRIMIVIITSPKINFLPCRGFNISNEGDTSYVKICFRPANKELRARVDPTNLRRVN